MKPTFRDKIVGVHEIDISADLLVAALLSLSSSETVSILDSCGVGHLGSHLLIAGIEPVETLELSNGDPNQTLDLLDEKLVGDLACIFTISYDFGLKLLGIPSRNKGFLSDLEPDVFLARFDTLIVHDYNTGATSLVGNSEKFALIIEKLQGSVPASSDLSEISDFKFEISDEPTTVTSNFTKAEYLTAIESIKELIRSGDTYQTNLTQQLTAQLPDELTAEHVFWRLRRNHPASFAAFIKRVDSSVVSASPERFIRVDVDRRTISTSPIKGTRPRGKTAAKDNALRHELLTSPKDIAENTMIVDLLRNDLGRICEYGSVRVEKLYDLEEHPTLFHLVSTISGKLRKNTAFSDILKAVFPCGSITGAPKISTMRIIDEIETVNRGLSMGAIGYSIPKTGFSMPQTIDMSVAIRTMTIRDRTATFNVGGGIVIDSNPDSEYDETLTKARALLAAIGGNFP